ncbi:MAG TPA: hypothetical protein VKH44_12900 [Pirellulaceae bacterium]|nr:hypothetical protein [Pirellulaceae bacterium]
MSCVFRLCCLPAFVLALAAVAHAAPAGLDQTGKPDLKSTGPLAFGPKGVLFVGDPQGAQIFAIDVGTAPSNPIGPTFKLEGADAKIAALLGTKADDITINDVIIEPGTNIAYVSVSRGKGPTAEPAIVRVDGKGNVTTLPLDKVAYSKVSIANAPADAPPAKGGKASPRQQSITDLGFVDGKLFIAGLSNEEFASKLRSIEFPFKAADTGASVEIIHTAHNAAVETRAPVRTFVPFNVGGEPQILAAYTCTPLVTFPVSSLKAGQKIRGKTVAELGNRNNPLDMIVYEKDGKQFLLLSNSARGVMKISTESIDKQPALTEAVKDGGKAGLPYETVESLKDIEQLDKLGSANAIVLSKGTLSAIALP